MAVEREIKLAAPPHFALPDLAEAIPDAVVTTSPSRRLRATYWDTPDLRLARSGVSLRYRVEEGEDSSGGRWTLKIAGDSRSSVLSRRELDFQGSPGSVPSEVARLVRAYVRSSTLARVARLETSDSVSPRTSERSYQSRSIPGLDTSSEGSGPPVT